MDMTRKPLGILPLGEVPELVVNIVAAHILAHLNLPPAVLSPMELPAGALDKRRLQYDAGILLREMESGRFKECAKVVALVSQDLFVPVFSHVLGEARQGGDFALVSLFRLGQNPDGSSAPLPLFYERAAKIALHELGHLFNLFHCDENTCLMHFSGGLEDLDQSSFSFCRYCSACLPF